MDAVQRVKNMVRHSLVVSPHVTNRELFARAQEIAPQAVEGITLRQFHARFRLPVLLNEMGNRRVRRARAERTPEGEVAARPAATAGSSRKIQKTTRPRRRAGASPAPGLEAAMREILVEFAVQLESAESRSDLVRVMGGVDGYTARILQIVERPRLRARDARAEPEPAPAAQGPSDNGSGPD